MAHFRDAPNEVAPGGALTQQLQATIGDADSIADAQTRRGSLVDRGPTAVVVFHADLIDNLRLTLLDLMARISAPRSADDRRDRTPGPAANETAETAADEAADDQPRAAGLFLLDDFAHRFDGADARRRRAFHDLVGRLRTTATEKQQAAQKGNNDTRAESAGEK